MLTYALARLGRDEEIRHQADVFSRECKALAPGHWATAEVAKAFDAIGGSGVTSGLAAPASLSDDDWEVGNAAALGLDTAILREHRALCDRSAADACLVIRQGRLVDEWYGPRYAEPITAMSSTKSITSLLVGLLIEDGKVSIETPVSQFIPEWRAGADAGVRVRHLLTMTSGLPDERVKGDIGSVMDKEAFAFSRPLVAPPGEKWAYTNDGVFLLSPLIKRAASEPVDSYARRRLFAPLGMRHTRMHTYPDGQSWTHADMETTARDFARIGQMMLDGGKWNGRQAVPAAWVSASTRKSQALADYGYLWWLDIPGGFAARGYLDTNLYVFPARGLVVVRMQSKPISGAANYESDARRLFAKMVR